MTTSDLVSRRPPEAPCRPGSAARSPPLPTSLCRRAASCAARRSASTTCCARPAGARCTSSARRCAMCWASRCPSIRASAWSPQQPWPSRRPTIGARAVAHFSGAMRTLVHQFKYADRHDARALFGRWLAEAGRELLAGGRRGGAGAADALAAVVAPVQPGRHPGPGAFAPDRAGAGPTSPASHTLHQDPGGPDPRPAQAQRGRCLQRAPQAESRAAKAATCCSSTM